MMARHEKGNTNSRAMNSRGQAFTLIELLVVIAIIGILAALLLPVLSRAKAAAQGTQCASDHRQLILAWDLYAHDHENGFAGFAGNMTDPFEATNASLLTDPRQTAMAQYVTDARIYKCPSDQSELVRSVSMNLRMNASGIGGWLHGGGDRYEIFNRSDQIRNPAEIFVILDERSDSINDGAFCVDMSNTGDADGIGTSDPYWMIDYPGGYHNGSGRFSFADGHVDGHRWVASAALAPPVPGQRLGPAHTSATDRDAQWLQGHCTYLK